MSGTCSEPVLGGAQLSRAGNLTAEQTRDGFCIMFPLFPCLEDNECLQCHVFGHWLLVFSD
jgi:hypothetical protein